MLDRLRPSAATRERVGAIARGLGLTVVNTTDSWAVTATGSAATIRAAFGSARATDPASPWAPVPAPQARRAGRRRDRGSGWRRDPPGQATADRYRPPEGQPPDDRLDGTRLRTAYRQSTDGRPPAGQKPLSIATLQFDGWYPADLRGYAAGVGLPDPIASGAFTAVSVAGANPQLSAVGARRDRSGPRPGGAARRRPHTPAQRAYFAPNTDTGAITALHRIAADAADASHSYYNLAALSVSWGACEPAYKLSNGAGIRPCRPKKTPTPRSPPRA